MCRTTSSPGTSLDDTPGVFTSANVGQLQLCDTAAPTSYAAANALTIDRDGTTQILLTCGGASAGVGAGLNLRSAPGPLALPTATQAGTRLGALTCVGHDGSAYKATLQVIAVGTEAWTGTANGTALRFLTTLTGGTTLVERLRLDGGGNLNTTGAEVATGLQHGLVLRAGTAATSSLADAVQAWVADRGGVAGQASLQVRSEDGASHVLGNVLGVNTLCAVSTLGSGEVYRRLTVNGPQLFVSPSSTQERPVALLAPSFVVATDASRTSRLTLSVHDFTAARECLRLETSGTVRNAWGARCRRPWAARRCQRRRPMPRPSKPW